MNEVAITIKNYRCFSDSRPARFTLKNGLTSFIGVNNVGKSSLLKFFYEFRDLFRTGFTSNSITEGNSQFFLFPSEVKDPQEIFHNGNDRPLSIEFNFLDINLVENLVEGNDLLVVRKMIIIVPRTTSYSIKIHVDNGMINGNQVQEVSGRLSVLVDADNQQRWFDVSHILTVLEFLKDTFYIGAFRNAINPLYTNDLSQQRQIQSWHSLYYDINIGAKLIQAWKEFKAGTIRQNRQEAIELTKQICQIFRFDSLEIFHTVNERDFLFSINGESYNLSDVGSGIAQFFVVLANIVIKKPSFILIDEPEINLHPSLQLEFLDILERYASNGVLYATHSVGLARHADQIYSVFKDNNNISNIREFENRSSLSELLGELSYSAYRELGFTKVLLVEGRTEVKVIQQFLRKYNKDNEFFIVSMGGSQYICEHSEDELREFMRASDKIFALIDSEKASSDQELDSSRQGFVNICERLGIDYHVLEWRATDNYFPDRVVKQIKGQNFQALDPYQKLGETSQGIQHWAKSENWRFAQAMTKDELESTNLGDFIKRICEI